MPQSDKEYEENKDSIKNSIERALKYRAEVWEERLETTKSLYTFSEKMKMDFKEKLDNDNLSQSEFIRLMVFLYILREKPIMDIVEEYKKQENKEAKYRQERKKREQGEMEELKRFAGIEEGEEVEDILDILDKMDG